MVKATPIETITMQNIEVWVKREDQNHPIVQGNKLHKLKYNLKAAHQQSAQTLVTFGGAYSNHLLATAYAAHINGFRSVGVVRGNELADQPDQWSDTLSQCQSYDMELVFVNRRDYRLKQHSLKIQGLLASIKSPYIVPEGGSNTAAIEGVAEWVLTMGQQLNAEPSHVLCPVGTGGTLAGLIVGCARHQWRCQVIGICVLKGLQSVKDDINQWLSEYKKDLKIPDWQLNHEFHGGGYAKLTPELVAFGKKFSAENKIPLDRVYNIKSFDALNTMIQNNLIKPEDRPLVIHTGGLQGGII